MDNGVHFISFFSKSTLKRREKLFVLKIIFSVIIHSIVFRNREVSAIGL